MNKKLLNGLLITIMIFLLVGCGNNKENMDLSNIIRKINWNMNSTDIISREGTPTRKESHMLIYENVKLDKYYGNLTYRLDENDKINNIIFRFNDKEDYNEYMKDFMGKHNNYKKVEKSVTYYFWYGNVDGVTSCFATDNSGNPLIEIYKER